MGIKVAVGALSDTPWNMNIKPQRGVSGHGVTFKEIEASKTSLKNDKSVSLLKRG